MEVLKSLLSNEYFIYAALVGIILLQFILIIVLFVRTSRMEDKYRKIMRGVNTKNLETLIVGYLDKIDEVEKNCESIKSNFEYFDHRLKRCIQKTAILRYRAFDDVGSDLSYSIALLDDSNDGVIITGIYGRNESTSYAKPIDKGISRYDLSGEEDEVLNNAINNYKNKEISQHIK